MGFATDNAKSLAVQVNATSGGKILYPLANHRKLDAGLGR
jgi:hypothetical protein